MNNINEIIIKRVKGRERDYIASYYNDFLKANFSVYFTDNVFGAVALTRFSEMIKQVFNEENVRMEIIEDFKTDRNSPVLEILDIEIFEKEVM